QTLKSSWALDDVEIDHELVEYNHAIALKLGEEIQKIIDERITMIKMELKNPIWISNFSINERIVNRYQTGREFVARGK
ncbi:40451_t:CDS:2, partial [Gigaspora margarita]